MVFGWRALLFLRGVAPSEIEAMDFFALRHWAELTEMALDAEKTARRRRRSGAEV